MKLRALLIAAVAATSLAAALPGPAVAGPDTEDLLKLLAAGAAAGLIAREVQRNNAGNDGYLAPVQRGSSYDDRGYGNRSGFRSSSRQATLPAECAQDYEGRRGWSTVYGASCLRQTGFNARLPDNCALDIRTSRGTRTVYEEGCLRNSGFRVSQQRY